MQSDRIFERYGERTLEECESISSLVIRTKDEKKQSIAEMIYGQARLSVMLTAILIDSARISPISCR